MANHAVRDVDGEILRQHDLAWPQAKAAAEYDGRHHAERVEQWEADLERREASDDDEWRPYFPERD